LIDYLTLTTDYGLNDPYPAMLRGSILTARPSVQLIDITHSISKFNIREAAYVLKNCYSFYPTGSLHLVDVSSSQINSRDFLFFAHNSHFFLLPDNGICSLLTDNAFIEPRRIEVPITHKGGFDLLTHVLPQLLASKNQLPEDFGPVDEHYAMFTPTFPSLQGNRLMGRVQYIDSYRNVITNIDRAFFERHVKRDYIIYLKRSHKGGDTITQIVHHFGEVDPGDIAGFFGQNDFLQIAMHGGNAADLLGLRIDDAIMIEIL